MIVIATFNELQTLPQLVQEIWQYLPEANILVVDDNSPDGTGQWVRELAENNHRIELLHRENKTGLGAAAIAGLTQALARNTKWIATMDGDLSHRAVDLERMWKFATTHADGDVVIGSRYAKGGRIENWSLRRRVASRCVNWFARRVLWLKSRDSSGALRIYRHDALEQIDLSRVNCAGFAYLEQILLHLQKSGAAFQEVPIVFREREQGNSKVTIGELIRNLRDILRLAILRR